mgnify:CR=1 FL=1
MPLLQIVPVGFFAFKVADHVADFFRRFEIIKTLRIPFLNCGVTLKRLVFLVRSG